MKRLKAIPALTAVFMTAGSIAACFSCKGGRPEATPHVVRNSPPNWTDRAELVSRRFHDVYTPCWEGAYGAIGDAYLYSVTKDSALPRFHLVDHDLTRMCRGTWVDDRAWICLAEFKWWDVTGRTDRRLVLDARQRYIEARGEGRLSHHEGFWSWYNWPPQRTNEQVFTNSNMNQMVTVACELFRATGERQFLEDALRVWDGDKNLPGIERTWYRGNGVWEGRGGRAAFGNQLPWLGAGYCSVASALYRATKDQRFMKIAIETARHVTSPSTGWVDPNDFYQIQMDGNGAFVNFLFDAFAIAPEELPDLPAKIEKMLDHVWTNAHGAARVTLHRETDHAIRNGWNPAGGEDGYNVDEIGTVHAQGEASRAFGILAFALHGGPSGPKP